MEPMDRAYAEIARYREITPQHRESLDFLRKIIEFQSSLLEEISAGADKTMTGRQVTVLQAHEKLQSGQPLFEKKFVPVPPSLFHKSLKDLRTLLPEGPIRSALDRLLALETMAPENIETVIHELKTDIDSCIRRLAKVASTTPDILHFLLQTVLSPFFENQAGYYRELAASGSWRQGKCPVCGSDPAIARLAEDNGQRFLSCSLCHTEWAFERLRCPFCEHNGPPRIRHFTVDDDKIHRVECCDICRRYLKVVDERVAGHRTSPSVEDIVTVQLDILAGEQGYC